MANLNQKIPLSCGCGKVKGFIHTAKPQNGLHLICMCRDCQAYAHYLKVSDKVLDKYGGTEVYQIAPSELKLTAGQESVQCLQLSPKGIFRWYSQCCHTPIANTLGNAGVPFVGVPVPFIAVEKEKRDAVLGAICARIHAQDCRGQAPENSTVKAPSSFIFRVMARLFLAKVKGKAKPSPLFQHGKPMVKPILISREARALAYAEVEKARGAAKSYT